MAAVQEGGRGASEGRERGVAVTMLVATETGVAVALLIVMALLLQSFQRLRAINPGFEPNVRRMTGGRVGAVVLMDGGLDFIWAALFTAAYVRTALSATP